MLINIIVLAGLIVGMALLIIDLMEVREELSNVFSFFDINGKLENIPCSIEKEIRCLHFFTIFFANRKKQKMQRLGNFTSAVVSISLLTAILAGIINYKNSGLEIDMADTASLTLVLNLVLCFIGVIIYGFLKSELKYYMKFKSEVDARSN